MKLRKQSIIEETRSTKQTRRPLARGKHRFPKIKDQRGRIKTYQEEIVGVISEF